MHGARPFRTTRRMDAFKDSRPGWYKIVNSAAAGEPTQISIYDEIGYFGVSAIDFLADMKAVQGDIELHLNSPGGDVFDGISIYNQLRQRKAQVHVIVDGLAASAASFIAMAASPGKLEMAPHSQLMIHDGFAAGIGNAADMRDLADQLDRVSDEIAGIYADRTGKPQAYWRGLMQAETWFTDKQAVAAGLADKVHGQESAPENVWDLSVFARFAETGSAPVQGSPANAGSNGYVKRDGKWVFDPDGDGDDDSTPEGDTDHDYFGEDGSQKKAIPPDPDGKQGKPLPPAAGNKAVFPVLDADVDSSPWDASKAWKAGAASDDPAAFYRGICAGRKAGDPSTQGAWALPYKYSPKSPPNAGGVRDALSRLPQVQGLTNEDQAKATLQSAMKEVNPDYEPDDYIDPGLLAAVFTHGLERG